MKLIAKKIIAREFLILILSFTTGLMLFLCTYPYNAFKRNQIVNTKTEISKKNKLIDSLSIPYKSKISKQIWLFDKFSNHFDIADDVKVNTRDKMWKRFDNLATKDSLKYKLEKYWDKDVLIFIREIGFLNPAAFQSFIEKNRITKEEESNYNSSLAITSNVNLLSKKTKNTEAKILSFYEQMEFGFKGLGVIFIILFGLRYLFYSLKWSIKTLKQETD